MAQSFPRDCLVKSPHRLEQATLCKKSASMTDERQPEQVKQLVRFQHLPRDIQKEWWHLFYDDKWRRCHKCCTWCMLFVDFDEIHTVMHAHLMIAVVFGAYPVAEDEPKDKAASEVDNLMAKYDNDEKEVAFKKSDAYKLKLKSKADKEIEKQ